MRFHCACIDVDETLYNFSRPLYESFIRDGIKIPEPKDWNKWDCFYPQYMDEKIAISHFDEIHKRQEEFPPYVEASDFLKRVKTEYYVVITSHRNPERKRELSNWIEENNLPHDEIWVGNDKTEMFNKAIFALVVDDNPNILLSAKQKGIRAVGLKKPWNSSYNFELYDSLKDITV